MEIQGQAAPGFSTGQAIQTMQTIAQKLPAGIGVVPLSVAAVAAAQAVSDASRTSPIVAVLPSFRRRLLAWYRRHGRDLPWRMSRFDRRDGLPGAESRRHVLAIS